MALEPEYKRAATEMKAEGFRTVLAKVDATEESEIAGRFDVKGYPTIIFFAKGKQVQLYEGERDAEAIKTWLYKREEPDVRQITEADLARVERMNYSGFTMVAIVKNKSARYKAF